MRSSSKTQRVVSRNVIHCTIGNLVHMRKFVTKNYLLWNDAPLSSVYIYGEETNA